MKKQHVCVCASVRSCVYVPALSMCQCHQFIFVVALHFGLFYWTNYKRAVFLSLKTLAFLSVTYCSGLILIIM